MDDKKKKWSFDEEFSPFLEIGGGLFRSRGTDAPWPVYIGAIAKAFERLQTLNLRYTGLNDAGLTTLSHALQQGQLRELRTLDCCGTAISDDGIRALVEAADMRLLTKLERLLVSATDIADRGLEAISQAAERGCFPNLRILDLSSTRIEDSGVVALSKSATAAMLEHLEELDLGYTAISDEGFMKLADAAQQGYLNSLVRLNVCLTSVTVNGSVLETKDARQIFEWVWPRGDAERPLILREAKLLIVGQGGVGKTAFCHRVVLAGEEDSAARFEMPTLGETHDIDMHTTDLVEQDRLPLTLKVWDFGGQDNLHGTHKFFVGADRAVYCLVVDATQSAHANRLQYWLRFISHHGKTRVGPHDVYAPVIIVRTKCDKVHLAKSGVGTTGDASAVLSDIRNLEEGLRDARKRGWYGANVIDLIDHLGYPDNDGDLPSVVRASLVAQHAQAARRAMEAIRHHAARAIGVNYPVPDFAIKIRDWIRKHFDESNPAKRLGYFSYNKSPFIDFVRAEGLDRDRRERRGSELGSEFIVRRIQASLRLLKSLGSIHWIGDLGEAVQNPDSDTLRLVFNPRWVKTPVYDLLRLRAQEYPNGWISQTELERNLLPERQALPHTVPARNDREWFMQLAFSGEDRGRLIDLMVDSRVALRVAAKNRPGLLIPDCLIAMEPMSCHDTDTTTAEYECEFLPDRVLLRFLAAHMKTELEEGRRLPPNIFRNWARLAWHYNGKVFDVWLQVDPCPSLERNPWMRLAVSGGSSDGRYGLSAVIESQLAEVFAAEGLPRFKRVDPAKHSEKSADRGAITLDSDETKVVEWLRTRVADEPMCKQQLKVFWCIGVADYAAMTHQDVAKSYRDLVAELKGRASDIERELGTCDFSESYLVATIHEMQTLCDDQSFPRDVWAAGESMVSFREPSGRGRKPRQKWTARGTKAWYFVHAFLRDELYQLEPVVRLFRIADGSARKH